MSHAPRKPFVWPPRPLVPGQSHDLSKEREQARFIELEEPTPARARGVRPGSWEQIERTWLGLTTPPLLRRAADAGFTPDEPGSYCTRCGRGSHVGHGCVACEKEPAPWDRMVRVGPYAGLIGEVVRELKFERWRRVGMDLGMLMGAILGVELRLAGIERAGVRVMPVPSHWLRRLSRGVDHAAVLARSVATGAGVEYAPRLTRSFRLPQGGLSGQARRRNVRGTMRVRGSWEGISLVVVVDDVKTTGETLGEAVRAVKRGVRLWEAGARRGKNKVIVWGFVAGVAE